MADVVVTGASGFIGRAVCIELVQRGHTVYAISRTKVVEIARVKNVYVDAYDRFHGPDQAICIHLAGVSRASTSSGVQTVLKEAVILARCIVNSRVSRVVFASSALVYGDAQTWPRREDEPVNPRSPYAVVKRAVEEVFLAHGHVVARIANTYGVGMSTTNVLSDLLRQIPGEGEVRVRDTAPVRDYIHVRDIARGLADLALGASEGIYNLGTGIGTSVGELAALLLMQAGEEARQVVPLVHGDRPSWLVLDPSRMKTTFGWEPTVSLLQGLKDLLNRRDHVLAG